MPDDEPNSGRDSEALKKAVERLMLRLELQHDLLQAEHLFTSRSKAAEHRPSARRVLLRAFLALIEADANVRISVLLDLDEQRRVLRPAVVSALRGESYVVGADGNPIAHPAPQRLIDKVRVSLRGYMDLLPEAPDFFRAEYSDDWNALDAVWIVGQRIMNPRSAADLNITDEELATLRRVEGWYDSLVEGLFTEDKGCP